jgi:putative glutathione S-transferase
VYHTHFKCNKKRLAEYPNLWAYTRDIYQMDGVEATFNALETRKHYFGTDA